MLTMMKQIFTFDGLLGAIALTTLVLLAASVQFDWWL